MNGFWFLALSALKKYIQQKHLLTNPYTVLSTVFIKNISWVERCSNKQQVAVKINNNGYAVSTTNSAEISDKCLKNWAKRRKKWDFILFFLPEVSNTSNKMLFSRSGYLFIIFLINQLISKMSEKSVIISLNPKATSSNCLFCRINGLNPNNIQFITENKEKQQTLTLEELKPVNVWLLFLKNDFKHNWLWKCQVIFCNFR